MPTILVQPEYSLNSWCQSSSYQTHTHTHNQPHIFVRSFTQVHLAQRVKTTLEPFLSVIRSQT